MLKQVQHDEEGIIRNHEKKPARIAADRLSEPYREPGA